MKFLNRWFYLLVAYWAIILKKHDIAADYMVLAAALKPKDPRLLTTAASCMNAGGRNAEAESLLRRAVEISPDYAAAWFNLGFLIQKRQDHNEAVACFEQAIRQDEKLDRAHYGRALSLMALGRHEEAKAALERTIDLQPMSPYGYYQLASLHHKLGDEKACIKLVRKLHKFEPQLAVQLQRETGVQAGVTDPFSNYRH